MIEESLLLRGVLVHQEVEGGWVLKGLGEGGWVLKGSGEVAGVEGHWGVEDVAEVCYAVL